MSLTCPRCNVENRDQAKRCMACNQVLTQSPPVASGRPTNVRLCPSGRHPMDPGWQVCPYCEADRKAKREAPPRQPPPLPSPAIVREVPMPPVAVAEPAPDRSPPQRRNTAFVGALGVPASAPMASPPPSPLGQVASPPLSTPEPAASPSPVQNAPAAPQTARRGTVFVPQGAPPPAEASAAPPASVPPPPIVAAEVASPPPSVAAVGSGRRIVGVLVTYTWHREGQIFPVREGRNFLGNSPGCDIAVDADTHLSSRHATILYRGRGFWIDDEKSMNGTFVNDECVEEKQQLPNYARIRTGSTEWCFVILEPAKE